MNIFKLEEYLSQYEFSAPYLLCCSDAESFSMQEILRLASNEEKEIWENLRLGYTEVPGSPLLRQSIAKNLYPTLDAENILCFSGAGEGIFCALHALCEPEDHVIVLTPCYQSLCEIPKIKGAEVTEIMLHPENDWRINLSEIKKAITPKTVGIIINFPHNPTGQIIERQELSALVKLGESHNLWIFSDEVYRLLGPQSTESADPACMVYPKALSLGVTSKAFGLGGLRVGWIACQDTSLLKKLEYMKQYTSLCNSAPAEILSVIAINNKEALLARNNLIIENNLNLLDTFFDQYENLFTWIRPKGGCTGFVKYKAAKSVEVFCQTVREEAGVLLLPASVYDYPNNYFRIGFGRKDMPDALDRLKRLLT